MRYRTAVVPVSLSPADYRRAHNAAHQVAGLWNTAVTWVREQWESGDHRVDKFACMRFLSTLPTETRTVHVHTMQAVAHDLFDAVETFRVNRRNAMKVRAPWRQKNYRSLTFTRKYGWSIDKRTGKLRLSLGRHNPAIFLPVPKVSDPVSGELVDAQWWGSIKLCWDRDARRWSLHIAVPACSPAQLDPASVCAIDEGIINPVTLAAYAPGSCHAKPVIDVTVVNGRELRAIKRDRNKAVGQITRKLSRCATGSRRHRKLTLAKKKQCARANARLRDARHQISADVTQFAIAHDTGTITAGDVRGIEQRTARKRRSSRSARQQLSQWDRGKLEQLIAFKTGVQVGHIDEAYSSQTCPACLARNRPNGRRYRCRRCAFGCHRDAVGAINILMLILYGTFVPIDPNTAIRVTYLRAVKRWSPDQREAHRKVRCRKAKACSTALNSATGNHMVADVAGAHPRSSATGSSEPAVLADTAA